MAFALCVDYLNGKTNRNYMEWRQQVLSTGSEMKAGSTGFFPRTDKDVLLFWSLNELNSFISLLRIE